MKKNFIIGILIFVSFNILQAQVFEGVRNSMFADIKAHSVGDVITVLVIEQTKSEQNSRTENSNKSSMSANASTSGNITDFLPLFSTNTAINNQYDGREGTEQNEKLVGKITATIVDRTESGALKIEGRRMLEVNGEKNLMEVKGMVRPKDIMTDNTVFSYNIANAEIAYKKGSLNKRFIKPGTVQRLLTLGIGAGLLALAYIGFF